MKEARAREIKKRIGQIQQSIRLVLLHDWDPIGVAQEPQAQDEYDSYTGEVYRLLASAASEQQVADRLRNIETDRMGLPATESSALLAVARKLKALDIRLVDRGPAA
jgi:hypothetical protein